MNISIFGSCVSRDAFALAPMDGYSVAAYVARSSLALMMSSAVEDPMVRAGLMRIESAFQQRMVAMDLDKQGLEELMVTLEESSAVSRQPSAVSRQTSDVRRQPPAVSRQPSAASRQPPAEFVLLDLIDERFDIVRVGGSWATRSSEFLRMQLPEDVLGERLATADPRRQGMWLQGAKRVVEAIGPQRLILNKPFWARRLSDGTDLPNTKAIDAANACLERMYRVFDDLGVRFTIDYPEALLVADADHKWGISPFHYIPPFYTHTMQSLAAIVSGPNA